MGIQDKDNFNKYAIMLILALLHCSIAVYAVTPEQVLLKSYEKNYSKSNLKECDKVIVGLESVLKECNDKYLACRIEYRIGVLNFCIEDYKMAYKAFNEAVGMASDYDVLVSALNMKANCARFTGKPKDAIACFQELAQKIEKQGSGLEFENKLIVSSYYSMAQLYSQIGDVAGAIRIYTTFIEKYEKADAMKDYVFKAMQSKARKLFESGDIKRYLAFLKVISDSDALGDSKGILELQQVCMNFILKNNEIKGLTSVAKIPVHAVAVVASNSNCDALELLKQIAGLSKKFENTKSIVYINYTYAWLLDASGNKQDSLKAFKEVIETCKKAGVKERYYYLGEYAKVQSSVMSGELRDYNSAIKMIGCIDTGSAGHLLQISESVKKSLATLKREVPKDD
jgi:hypothetical protein